MELAIGRASHDFLLSMESIREVNDVRVNVKIRIFAIKRCSNMSCAWKIEHGVDNLARLEARKDQDKRNILTCLSRCEWRREIAAISDAAERFVCCGKMLCDGKKFRNVAPQEISRVKNVMDKLFSLTKYIELVDDIKREALGFSSFEASYKNDALRR